MKILILECNLFFRRPYGIDTINSIELRRNAGLLCGTNSKFKSNESPFTTENFQNKMRRLNQIHSAYTRMKMALRDDPICSDHGLSMISDQLPNELRQIYDPSAKRSKVTEYEETKGNVLKDNIGDTIGHRRKQLRQKFYGHESISYREQHVSICLFL